MNFNNGDRVWIKSFPSADAMGYAGARGTVVGSGERMSDGALFWTDKTRYYEVCIDAYHQGLVPQYLVCGEITTIPEKYLSPLPPLEQLAECADA